MEEIYEMLPEGIFNDFNGFSEYVNQNGIKSVYEMLPEGIFNDEQGFLDYAEKKNPIVTPSNGEEVVTESTTETETTPGSSDGLEVNEVVEVDEQVDFREQMNPMNALTGDTENLIPEEEVQNFLTEDLNKLLDNSDIPLDGFYMAGQHRARSMRNANKTIDETLKLKIEADPNIQKALAVGYIKESDVISALKGNRKSIEKLQDIAVRSTEDNILKLQSEDLKPYDVYSETKNYIETEEDKAIKTEAIRAVNSFNSETQKLLDANPDATEEEMQAIFQREGSPTEEQFDIAEDADYQPTGFENEQLGRMYNQIALKKLSDKNEKFNIAGFNGYLKKKGFLDKYNQLLEDETISEDGRSYDYSGNYNPTLAAERLKYDYLKNYLAESDMQRIEKEVLEYKIANNGRNPFLHGDTDKINLKPSIKSEDLSQYMIEEFKTLAAVVEKQKAKTKENYQRELEGGVGGDNTQWLLDSGYQGGRSVVDRVNSTSEWGYGWLGMDSVVDEIQMNQAETELNRDDMLRYTFASGKSAFANGREYMIDDRGEIYDLDLKIRVSSVLEPSQIEEIRKQVSKNGVETSSFSGTGAAVTTAGVASDMLLQIALTRGVGIAGQTIKGISAASKYKQGRNIINLLEKVPMRATTASAMIAQGTLMASSLSSDVRKQALAAGMSNEEADELAASASMQGYALGVLTAPISTQRIAMDKIFGTKAKEKLIQKSIDAYTKGGGIEASKSIFKKGLDKVITNGGVYLGEGGKEFIQENIQQGGQAYVIGDNINEQAGQEIMRDTISADEFMNTSIISLTAGMLMPFAGDLKTGTVNSFKVRGRGFQAVDQMKALALMSSDSDKTKQLLDSQVKKGVYTPEQVENIMADVEIYKSTINGLPPNLSAETSLLVMSDLAKIKELEAIKQKENPAFPDFRTDVEIQKLKNRIIKNSNFDFINNKEKQKFMDNAGKELVAEKEAAGEKNYKINNSEIRNRAVENFNKLSIEEMKALAFPDQKKESETKTEKDAIQEPSTEKQVLPNDATSQTDGADSEVELQQVGEGDVGTDTDTQVEEGETQTDTTSDTTTEADAEQLTEGERYLESKRKIVEDLEAKDKSLRNEDGSVSKENQKAWKENRAAIVKAKQFLLTGDTTGKTFGSMRSYEEGSTQSTATKSDEQIKKNENEIESVIQKVIDGKITAEDATQYIAQKFGFYVDQVAILSRYIAERSDSSFPEIGNNKSKFKDWRKGNKTSDTTTQTDTEQLTEPTSTKKGMIVNNDLDNKIESFANRMADADTSNELSDEAIEFYSENQEAIDKRVSEIRKESPKDKSKTRRLATKIAKGETNFSNEQIDLYAANEAEVQAEVEAIAKTNSQTVTADTYKGILKSIKSTTRTDKARQEGENAQRKRFWKSWNKANREGKKDLKTKRKELNDQIKTYAKGKKGTITAAQTRAVINRVNTVNLDNELAVQKLIDYSEKIFNDADFAVKEAQAIKLNSDVTKKLNSGAYGLNTDLNTRLSNILNTPISNLTSENIDSYNDFLKRIKNSKKSELAPFILEAQNLFDSLYVATPEVSEEVETKEAESLKNIVDKIIDKDVDGETLLKDNSKFIENDLGKLDSFELETLIDKINLAETDENTDIVQAANNYAESRQKVLNNIKSRSKGITLKNLDATTREAGDVNVYKNIKDSDIVGLTGNQLMELEVTLENINEGFYTHAANKLGQSINSRAQDIMPMIMKYGTGKHKAAMIKTYGAGFLKSKLTGKGVAQEMIRSNPLSVIDNVFGNYDNENIRNNTFTPIGSKYAAYNAWAAKATDKLAAVEKLLAPSLKESVNKSVERNFEVQMYLLALESESNPGVKGIDTPNGYVSAVVKKYNKNPQKSRYNESDIAVLEAMLKKYNDNGVVTTKKMDESLSPKVKKAIKIMRDVYNSLSDKQAYATTIVRGGKLDLLNNYVHHKMDVDTKGFTENRDQNDSQLQSQMGYFNSSTKSKTSISRTGVSNNKSIDFSPVSSALRAVRAVGMDYYLTNEIQTERKALNELIKITERNTDRKEVIQAAKDLNEVYTEAIDNVIGSNFSTNVVGGKLMDVAKRIGYYGTLASVPRAVAELGSNLTFALLDSPLETMDGMTKYGKLGLGQNGMAFAINVGAISYTKLYNSEILSGSKAEQGGVVRNKKTSSRTKQTKLGEGIEYAGRFTSQGAKGIEFVADNLLSTPDKMISRPLFFGTFGRTFKSITGQEMDVNKISENDQEYMEKYADAIKESRIAADKAVTQAATSNDPFSGVLKNQLKAGAGNTGKNYYRTINSYMARFTINEYATARQAIASMVGQGNQSPIQGAAKLTAVMARMSLYVVAYKGLTALWQSMLGLDDEDDVDYGELATRQAVGAGVSLITRGVSGNVPMYFPNYIIEMLNEDYGEELGLWSDEDGEGYNQYKHSLIFSLINSESVERKGAAAALVNVISGPLSNQVNASLRVANLLAKMDSKNPTVANRAYEEFMSERTAIEMLNIPGAVPFYKDVRRYYVAKNWSEVKEAKRLEENKGKPLSIKQTELINPRKAAEMRRKKKELKEKRNNDPKYQANLRAKKERKEKRDRELRRRRRR